MFSGCVINVETQNCFLSDVIKTSNIFDRMRGLLFRAKLKPMQALWIEPCPSVHTFGMKYPIDVVFLDKNGNVLKVVDELKPYHMAMCKNAVVSLELLSGDAARAGIHIGMQLNWQKRRID